MSIQLLKTDKSWFSHNIKLIEQNEENWIEYDILICCNPEIFVGLQSEFQNLSYPFKNRKIGIVNTNSEIFGGKFSDLNNNQSLLIFIDDENNGVEYYQSLNRGSITNSWIFVHPSLTHDQKYFQLLQSDLQDGTKKIRFVGHQTHITPIEMLEFLQNHGIESSRLGQIRQNIDMVEPWCRTVDHVFFHMESMRKSDFKAKSNSNPGGFTYEEACKLSQFMGASSHLKSIAYLIPHEQLLDSESYSILAQLIWYLIDGFHNFREDKTLEKNKLTQYIVHASHRDLDINFWKNIESGRWWMEVPGHENYWISCTYDDYLEASQGEFSSKLIHALNRM